MARRQIMPLGDRVLLENMVADKAKGILLPDDVETDTELIQMRVSGVGTDLDGVKVKKGDAVLLAKFSGEKLELDGTSYRIVKGKDLLATIN